MGRTRGLSRAATEARGFIAALAFAATFVPGVAAQDDVQDLTSRCAGVDPTRTPICREAALALQAAQSGMGLLAVGGAQVPGSSSTLGRRFGGMPRLSGSLRASFGLLDVPDVRSSSPPLPGRSYVAMATQASLAVGILDGFSFIPTVGGVLALDLFATAGVLKLPESRGFQDGSSQWGLGANIGLLRESFTLPGVSVSVAKRFLGETQLGSRGAGDALEVHLDPTVTSVRSVVGKDLLAFGVLAGLGWDRYSSDGSVVTPGTGAGVSVTEVDGFSSERMLGFGGLSLSLLVLQLSAEAGWARGFDAVPGRASGGYDPEGSSMFLSVAARLTL